MKTTNRIALLALLFTLALLPLFALSQNKKVKVAATSKNQVKAIPASVALGKYGCTASKYRNGSYEFIPRGSFLLEKTGKYTYNGFEKPSTGTFTVDAKGNLQFKGGYFDGGEAEKIDRPNKFFLVFPHIPDNRWTCSLIK